MENRVKAFLNQPRHYKCPKFPCIFYRSIQFMKENPIQYLSAECGCIPVSLTAIRGNKFQYAFLEKDVSLEEGTPAEICIADDDWIFHVKGIATDIKEETFVLKDLSGEMIHRLTNTHQVLTLG